MPSVADREALRYLINSDRRKLPGYQSTHIKGFNSDPPITKDQQFLANEIDNALSRTIPPGQRYNRQRISAIRSFLDQSSHEFHVTADDVNIHASHDVIRIDLITPDYILDLKKLLDQYNSIGPVNKHYFSKDFINLSEHPVIAVLGHRPDTEVSPSINPLELPWENSKRQALAKINDKLNEVVPDGFHFNEFRQNLVDISWSKSDLIRNWQKREKEIEDNRSQYPKYSKEYRDAWEPNSYHFAKGDVFDELRDASFAYHTESALSPTMSQSDATEISVLLDALKQSYAVKTDTPHAERSSQEIHDPGSDSLRRMSAHLMTTLCRTEESKPLQPYAAITARPVSDSANSVIKLQTTIPNVRPTASDMGALERAKEDLVDKVNSSFYGRMGLLTVVYNNRNYWILPDQDLNDKQYRELKRYSEYKSGIWKNNQKGLKNLALEAENLSTAWAGRMTSLPATSRTDAKQSALSFKRITAEEAADQLKADLERTAAKRKAGDRDDLPDEVVPKKKGRTGKAKSDTGQSKINFASWGKAAEARKSQNASQATVQSEHALEPVAQPVAPIERGAAANPGRLTSRSQAGKPNRRQSAR